MLVQSVQFTFAPQDAGTAEALFRELREASRKEEGVVAFEVARGVEKPNLFALWEVYRDERALETHRATDHFRRLVLEGVRSLAIDRVAEIAVPI